MVGPHRVAAGRCVRDRGDEPARLDLTGSALGVIALVAVEVIPFCCSHRSPAHFLPTLVAHRELVAANSGIWTAAVLSQIALAPLAGILYAALGAGPAFAINAASFLVSAAALAGLHPSAGPAPTERPGFITDAAAGVQLLRALAAGQPLAALSAGATSALLVVLARDHLGLPPSGYGMLLARSGSARCSVRSCSPGWLPTRADQSSCSAPTRFAASSTSRWPR